jgi:hypothetical protein
MRQATSAKCAFSAVVVGAVLLSCGGRYGVGSPLAAVLGQAACPEITGNAMTATFVEDARANATIRAFVTASGDLALTAARVEADVFGACERIAEDLGIPERDRRPARDESRVAASCNAVLVKMEAILRAGAAAHVRAEFTPPRCEVNADVEAACKAQCRGYVEPGDIKATCAPGHLYGRCDGTCTGTCSGVCRGQCDGRMDTSGRCEGTCTGDCSGDCRGRCSVDFQEPKCDLRVTPPSADVRCESACKAHADLTARCTEARVMVRADVNVGEMGRLVDTLSRNLPPLITAQIAYGKRLAGDIQVLVRSGVELPKAFAHLSARAGACLAASANATVTAEVSLRVSVQMSASINAKAGATATGGERM